MIELENHIQHLRVRGARREGPALRLALASRLDQVEMRPAGMPPAAVLIVRRIDDPLPGRLGASLDAARVDPAWERALRGALADHYRRAVRPSRSFIPSDADAVLFADRGEMLACLALDLSRGEAAMHWWWSALLNRLRWTAPSGVLAALLHESARYVPAMLHHLALWNQAETVVRALTAAESLALLDAVCDAFDLPRVTPDVPAPARHGESPMRGERLTGGGSANDGNALSIAPWRDDLPPELLPGGLERERAGLLGVSLLIHRRSSRVRSLTFRRSLQRWWRGEEEREVSGDRDDSNVPVLTPRARSIESTGRLAVNDRRRPERSSGRAHGSTTAQPDRRSKNDDASTAHENASPSNNSDAVPLSETDAGIRTIERRWEPAARGSQSPDMPDDAGDRDERPTQRKDRRVPANVSFGEATREIAGPDTADTPRSSRETLPGERESAFVSDGRDEGLESPAPHHSSEPASVDDAPTVAEPRSDITGALALEGGVYTRLGGVLYLLNLMRYLDLPESFEESWRLGEEIGPWGLLEAMARALLGPEHAELMGDAIWGAFAVLDGREPRTLPGHGLRGSERFQLPAPWVEAMRIGRPRLRWSADDRTLRLWIIDEVIGGVMLAEIPRNTDDPRAQAESFLSSCGFDLAQCELMEDALDAAPCAPLAGPFVDGLDPVLARWLRLAMPYIEYRLRGALGEKAITEAGGIAGALLLHTGTLYVTSSHVDLVMPIDAISLPLRMAGLDRDPGWLPRFGRVVQFHFE